MPRPSKGPRLSLKKGGDRQNMWIIRDGARNIATGYPEKDRAGAERKLGQYIIAKHDPRKSRTNGDTNAILIVDALNVYLKEVVPKTARPKAGIAMCLNLAKFFQVRIIGELNGSLQRAYAAQRGSQSAARRELETLSAAINHTIKDMVGGANLMFRPVLPRRCAGTRAMVDARRSGQADPRGMAQA